MNSTKTLFKEVLKLLKPPRRINVSAWAALTRMLSSESSPEPGKWSNERAPYQVCMMDAFNEKNTQEITVMAAAQTAKTEIILNMIGFIIDNDPGPIMLVQPTKTMARSFSRKRLEPMLRDCKSLAEKVQGYVSNVTDKYFPGGFLFLIGSNSSNELAGTPIRYLFLDEVDRYKSNVGDEGDPVELAEKRTANFSNRKKVRVSTPGLKGTSKIYSLYLRSTQETWRVPCPKCGEYQKFKIENFEMESLEMCCEKCGAFSNENEWKSKEKDGEFIAENPQETDIHRGFYLSSFSSPWVKWEEIARKYREALDDPFKMQVFHNTYLGLPFEHEFDEGIAWEILYKNRRVKYLAEVPNEVLFLTCAVDVQDDRLEVEVIGWGARRQRYGIVYKIIVGDPGAERVWKQLDDFLNKDFYFEDKISLNILCTFIDTGGHHTQESYDFIYLREHQNIYGIKGIGTDGRQVINTTKKTKRKNGKDITLISLGVNALKDMTYSSLRRDEEGPLYCYYPDDISRGYGEKYFQSVTGEIKTTKTTSGTEKIEWKKIRDNEALDIRGYGTAAMIYMNPDFENLSTKTRKELSELSRSGRRGNIKKVNKRKVHSKGVE